MNQTIPNDSSTLAEMDCNHAELTKGARIGLMSLYVLCCAVSVVGNGLVILAVARTSALRNVSMFFVASLSAADLLLGISMNTIYTVILAVYELDLDDLPPGFFESLMKGENYFWILTITATTFNLCAVTIDRFIAVVRPLRYHQILTEKRCYVTLAFIWGFSALFPTVRFFIDDFLKRRYLWLACAIIAIAIPFLVLIFCYAGIAKVTRRQVRAIHEASVDSGQAALRVEVVSNRKTAVTAVIVGGMFFLMFFPVLVVFVMLLVPHDWCTDDFLNTLWLWVNFISFCHSAINPWVYCYRSKRFRAAFKQIICN